MMKNAGSDIPDFASTAKAQAPSTMRRVIRSAMVLVALLQAQAGAAAAQPEPGPVLTAVVEERTVGVRLTNGGTKPLSLHLGWSCSGPRPFVALIDGKERSFVTSEKRCTRNVP